MEMNAKDSRQRKKKYLESVECINVDTLIRAYEVNM